ncbi:hypothetical protein [Profundibacterium mesophilum]|uniref:Uncharacterized protein n=1 Tax=Profundibacterium mesophilum KAUST100406-0324 TaxID=1037889 RepID=A0A921NR64_9RHOB|nr:hypothetical protein [Profundibacterium mesophilum]KAF0674659.1 hypothetical protein PMES_03041 [Profundibacterium mesophilum KAUST100406-0324]
MIARHFIAGAGALILAAGMAGAAGDADPKAKDGKGKADAAGDGSPALGPGAVIVTIPKARNPLPPGIIDAMRLRLLERAGIAPPPDEGAEAADGAAQNDAEPAGGAGEEAH